jgi:hypothetical protein
MKPHQFIVRRALRPYVIANRVSIPPAPDDHLVGCLIAECRWGQIAIYTLGSYYGKRMENS